MPVTGLLKRCNRCEGTGSVFVKDPPPAVKSELAGGFEEVINRTGSEKFSNTPDFILAEFAASCVQALHSAIKMRDEWYGISPYPGKEK